MRIVYYDKVRRPEIERELGATYLSLDDLLKMSDFVSIHVPLTPETSSLIGEEELRRMKKTAYIINTSRGKVIDEEALIKALEEHWIAGAGLDVFAVEPLPLDSPLIKMDNVVLTPHMGTHTVETRRLMVSTVAEDIRRVLTGKPPLNQVPEQRGRIFPVKGEE
jgi:phosphoglycerate dehydrogenase-like enzyme